MLKKKSLAQFSKSYRTLYLKICNKALKNRCLGSWIRDPGSGINLFRVPDPGPGVKKASDPWSATLQLCTTLAVMKSFHICVKHFVLFHTVKLPTSKKFLSFFKPGNAVPIHFFISPVLLPVPTGLRYLFQKVSLSVWIILYCTVKLPISSDHKLY